MERHGRTLAYSCSSFRSVKFSDRKPCQDRRRGENVGETLDVVEVSQHDNNEYYTGMLWRSPLTLPTGVVIGAFSPILCFCFGVAHMNVAQMCEHTGDCK